MDPASGYRYYSAEQIPTAQVIHRLRELDVPLGRRPADPALPRPGQRGPTSSPTTCAGWSPSSSGPAPRWRRCAGCCGRSRLGWTSSCAGCRRPRSSPPSRTTWSWTTSSTGTPGRWPSSTPSCRAGRPARRAVYDNALFESGRGRVLVYVPMADPPRIGRVRPATLPAVELAVTTHVGPHDDIDVTYGELGAWVVEHLLAVAGPVRETYLVGPRDTDDPPPGAPRSAGRSSRCTPAEGGSGAEWSSSRSCRPDGRVRGDVVPRGSSLLRSPERTSMLAPQPKRPHDTH